MVFSVFLFYFRTVLTVWYFLFFYFILELFWQYGIFCFSILFWNCSDSMVFFVFLFYFGTVLTVWYFLFFYFILELFWQYGIFCFSFYLQNKFWLYMLILDLPVWVQQNLWLVFSARKDLGQNLLELDGILLYPKIYINIIIDYIKIY